MNIPDQITQILKESFAPSYLSVTDDSPRHAGHAEAKTNGGGHYILTIVSDSFNSLNSLDRHRRIYKALKGFIPDSIHALSITVFTENEWKTDSKNEKMMKR